MTNRMQELKERLGIGPDQEITEGILKQKAMEMAKNIVAQEHDNEFVMIISAKELVDAVMSIGVTAEAVASGMLKPFEIIVKLKLEGRGLVYHKTLQTLAQYTSESESELLATALAMGLETLATKLMRDVTSAK